MSARPWMPLYIADYRADTTRLSAAEHGAYLLLIMEYWHTGGLPDDDRQLARVACMTEREWRKVRPIISGYFQDGWKHKRIDEELARTADISSKRRASALQRHSKTDANAHTLHTSHTEANASGAKAPPDPKAELFSRGRIVLGKDSGGLIAKLLRSFGKEDDPKAIAKARARIEEASTKAKPAEWLGRVMAPKPGEFNLMSGVEGVI